MCLCACACLEEERECLQSMANSFRKEAVPEPDAPEGRSWKSPCAG